MRRTFALAATFALAFGTLAACGGDDDDASDTTGGDTDSTETTAPPDDGDTGAPPAEGGEAVTLVAENIEWDEDSYTATAGEVSFVLDNQDGTRHTLVIDGIDDDTFKLEASGDETAEGSVELEAGDYELFCDVPGHAAMRAALAVE